MSTGLIDWNDVGGKNKSSGNGKDNELRFLRMKPDNTYLVRPLDKPIELWCYWNTKDNRTRRAICGNPETCPIQQKHGIEAQLRYAINVIDREDGLVKIMEAPPSVFSALRDWAEGVKADPGGSDGGDFQIKVKKTVTEKNTITKYSTQFMIQKPITEEEKAQITEMGGIYPLEKIYKPHTVEQIEERLFDVKIPENTSEEKEVFSGAESAENEAVATDVDDGLNF